MFQIAFDNQNLDSGNRRYVCMYVLRDKVERGYGMQANEKLNLFISTNNNMAGVWTDQIDQISNKAWVSNVFVASKDNSMNI